MEKEYWQHISEGRHGIFNDFYQDYFRKFYNFGRKFTKEDHLIEDSIQDVFVEIWMKRSEIGKLALPKAYFFAAFKNILLQKLRTQARVTGAETIESEESFKVDDFIVKRNLIYRCIRSCRMP